MEDSVNDQNPPEQNKSSSEPSPAALDAIQSVKAGAAQDTTAQELARVEKEMSGFERSTLRWARMAAMMSGAAALFVCLQWWEMHTGSVDTHSLAVAAGKQADRMKDFSDRMKEQSDRTKDLADRMKDQADRTKDLTDQATIQAKEARVAANAAKSAAETAKEALHVSERAYIGIQNSDFLFDQHAIQMPVVNTGRLPSGAVAITQHKAMYEIPGPIKPGQLIPYNFPAFRKWKHSKILSISQGDRGGVTVTFPSMDVSKLQAGNQKIVIAGTLVYTDGFPDSPQWQTKFCIESVASVVTKQVYLAPCDPDVVLPIFEQMDGYPNNEDAE
jgi:hypothetical protein